MFYPRLVYVRATCVARSRVEIWADPAGDERSAAAPAAKFHKCKYWHLGRSRVSHDWQQPNVYLHSKISPWHHLQYILLEHNKDLVKTQEQQHVCEERIRGHSRRVLLKLLTLGRRKQTCLGISVPAVRKSRIWTSALSQTVYRMERN